MPLKSIRPKEATIIAAVRPASPLNSSRLRPSSFSSGGKSGIGGRRVSDRTRSWPGRGEIMCLSLGDPGSEEKRCSKAYGSHHVLRPGSLAWARIAQVELVNSGWNRARQRAFAGAVQDFLGGLTAR